MGNFDVFAGIKLLLPFWVLSVAGGIAVWLSWVYVEMGYDEEGLLTRDSRCLVRARALLTASCIMFWICALLGHMLIVSRGTIFGFWIDHPLPLLALFLLADFSLDCNADDGCGVLSGFVCSIRALPRSAVLTGEVLNSK
jgi:hypothetical protein